jgi:hypothetical protein
VLNDLLSLMVHLKPAPPPALVVTCMPNLRTPIEDWLEREISVTTYLAEQGAPVIVPSQELPPGPHERDGFPISFWTYVEPHPNRTPTADDCSAMLVDLHTTLGAYPGELPMLCAGRYALRLRPKMRQCVGRGGADSASRRGTPPRSGVPRPAQEPGWRQPGTRGRPCPAARPARSDDAA